MAAQRRFVGDALDAAACRVDVGARYYTFIWTMLLCLRAAARKGIAVVVADRPNPINGVEVEGPLADADKLAVWQQIEARQLPASAA